MPSSQNGDVQISVSFDALIRAVEQFPTEALSRLLRATEVALATRMGAKVAEQGTQVEDEEFWESELGRYISAEADAGISLEEVRKALSVISGSLAEDVSRERDER